MLIVDAQVHIWAADTPERPWPPGHAHRAHRPVPFSKDDLLREMDGGRGRRAWSSCRRPGRATATTSRSAAARAHPDRFAVMGRPPLDAADPRALDHWREQPGMLGIRVTTAGAGARALFTEPEGDWLWPAAERNGMPAMVSLPGVLPEVGQHRRAPSRHAVCDRPSRPGARRQGRGRVWRSRQPAGAGEASECRRQGVGPAALFERGVPLSPPAPVSAPVFDAFGPHRMFWGTDLTGIPCTYRQAITLFTEELPWLTGGTGLVMGGRFATGWGGMR